LEENCLAAELASAVQEFFVLSVEQELLKDLECSDGSPAKMWGKLTQIGQIAVDTLVLSLGLGKVCTPGFQSWSIFNATQSKV
jgi:hypothetical protein